jgi:hypothetical protein
MMHGPINLKSPNNINKWQMGFNSAFKGLTNTEKYYFFRESNHISSSSRTEQCHKDADRGPLNVNGRNVNSFWEGIPRAKANVAEKLYSGF